MKTNKASCSCGCSEAGDVAQLSFKANLLEGSRYELFEGRQHLVVPLVMLRETVVNGGLVTLSELKPKGWNGVPVTIGHPVANGVGVSANSPKTLEQWRVGIIFNARREADKLKAEAWIDVNLVENRYPGLVTLLAAGAPMDVSTGYFSTDVQVEGVHNGKPYTMIHTDLKPDHLALLPGDTGACSWEDGCGVRMNKENNMTHKNDAGNERSAAEFWNNLFAGFAMKKNERGSDDDPRQMIADMISNDGTPFVPDDEYGLREMSRDTLKKLRDKYLPKTNSDETKGGRTMADEEKSGKASTATEDPKANQAPALTEEKVQEIVTNALSTSLGDVVAKAVEQALNANRRKELVEKLKVNMELEEAEFEKLSTNALESMAKKIEPKADYTGRGFNPTGDTSGDQPKFNAMAQGATGALAKKEEA